MKRKINFSLFSIAVIFLLTNCASTSKAPDSKSASAKEFQTLPDKGVVYLYRPGRAVGAATQTQIKVNGKDAGGTGPGTFFKWDLEPGKYVFSCYTSESSAAAELNVEENKQYFLRQDTRIGINDGRVTLTEVDETTGKEAVTKGKLLISTYH